MKQKFIFLLIVCYLTVFGQQNEIKQKLDSDWKFALGHAADPSKDFHFGQTLTFAKTNYLMGNTLLTEGQSLKISFPYMSKFDDSKWESIDLPHDWAMRLPVAEDQNEMKGYRTITGNSPQNSIGWYRKNVFIPNTAKGQKLYLQFDGIFRDARIWVNGVYIDRHESGYTSVYYDISEAVSYGENNLICVRVDATHSELWSYEGAGIYRHVWLLQKNPVHTKQWGTLVSSKLSAGGNQAIVSAKAEIENSSPTAKKVAVTSTIVDATGKIVQKKNQNILVKPLSEFTVEEQFSINSPQKWSIDTPNRYKMITTIHEGEKVLDTYTTPFGIRSIEWTANDGFHLNGKKIQIQGVCNHQDHAGVGVAVTDELNIWRLKQLKRMGCNALRTAHNPVAPELLNACDSLGLMVLEEVRMMSSSEEGLRQLEATITRDRNHPSIIIWGLGNEEPELQGSEQGKQIVQKMKEVQQKLDPSRLCTAAMNGKWGTGISNVVDVQGCNYFAVGNVDKFHKDRPNQPILFTEEASSYFTRGIYKTAKEKDYNSSYGYDKARWGSTPEEYLRYLDARPYIVGGFAWTGLDYGGEALPANWPGIISNFGIMDYCGFPKDAFYYYQAAWTKEPVLHLLPHWNWKEGDIVDVLCYTNASQVELFVNGKSLGTQTIKPFDIPKWKVPYEVGSIKAVATINGKQVTEEVFTTGSAQAVVLEANKTDAVADETIIVNVKLIDKNGRFVPDANNRIDFEISGGKILGVGNGDPSSHDPDQFTQGKKPWRSAFNGLAQVIIKAEKGKEMVLKAKADGLKEYELRITVR